jgi:porin
MASSTVIAKLISPVPAGYSPRYRLQRRLTNRRFVVLLVYQVFVVYIVVVFVPSAWANSNEFAKENSKSSIMTIAPDFTPVSDYTGDFRERSTLIGDPGGYRQRLYNKGVALDMGVTQVYQGVISGGNYKEWKYSAMANYSLSLDTQRLGLWPAGILVVHGKTKVGRSVNFTAGTLSPVNDPYTTPDSAEDSESFLEEYYLLQGLTGKLWFLAGRILFANFIDINRFAHDAQTQFMNTALKNTLLLGVLNEAWSSHGIALSYQATPNISVSPFLLSSNDEDGVWGSPGGLFSEYSAGIVAALRWKLGDLPGEAFSSFGHNSKDAMALDDPDLGRCLLLGLNLPHKNDNWVVGFSADQYFYMPERTGSPTVHTAQFNKTPEGIGVFLRFYYAPEDRNLYDTFVSGGVGGRGVIPSRPLDRYGLGFYALIESDDLDKQPVLSGTYRTEYGWEAFYNLAITPWLQFTPDLQYIRSGQTGVNHVGVFGMRLQIYF